MLSQLFLVSSTFKIPHFSLIIWYIHPCPGKPRERLRSESIAIETVDKTTDKDKQDDETADQAQPVEPEPVSKLSATDEEPKDGVEANEKVIDNESLIPSIQEVVTHFT